MSTIKVVVDGDVVDELSMQLVARKEEIRKLAVQVGEIETTLNQLASNEDNMDGTFLLEGNKLKVTITRKVNVSYPDKAKLSALVSEHKAVLGPLFRVELKESGSKVEKFLVTGDNQLAKELKDLRQSNPGKPSIEIDLVKAIL